MKIKTFFVICIILLAAYVSTASTEGQDSSWTRVYTADPASGLKSATAPRPVSLDAAHVGGNRILWRIMFAKPFVLEDTILILYLDLDNNENTGRTGFPVQGTDRMLVLADGVPDVKAHSETGGGRRFDFNIIENQVFFQEDLEHLAALLRNLPAGHKTPFEYTYRARILSHRISDGKDAWDTPWFTVKMMIDPSKLRPVVEDTGGQTLRDVSAHRQDGDLEIRFTTTEPLFAEVIGDGVAVCHWPGGMLRNHRWTLKGVPDGGKINYIITLKDELGLNLSQKDFTYTPPSPIKPNKQAVKERVKLVLNVDAAKKVPDSKTLWPVAGGIPFPEGQLFSDSHVRVLDKTGKERPVQSQQLSNWPDGSIKWLLVEFVADLPADISNSFTLEYGKGVKCSAVKPADLESRRIWTESIRLQDGSKVTQASVNPDTVEKTGPVTVVTKSAGDYVSDKGVSPFGFDTRTHRYPGLPFTRIEHTLTVDNGGPMARMNGLRMLFPFIPSGNGEDAEKVLRLDKDQPCKNSGFMTAKTVDGTLFIGVRNFSENWPIGISKGRNFISLDLLPELYPGQYDNRKDPQINYYWFENGSYKLRRGVHKTHEILYAFYTSNQTPPDGETLMHWLNNPPVLRAESEWVAKTGAAGKINPHMDKTLPQYVELVEKAFLAVEKRREKLSEYGFMNFGDWFGERGHNWGNLEYDLAHGLWLHWLASGDYKYYQRAEQAASHMADIDVVHSDQSPINTGRVWGHSAGHTGGYFPPGSFNLESFFTEGFWDTGHTWCEGILDLYLMTGDNRYKESGLSVADRLASYETVEFQMRTERNAGWPLIALIHAYELTNDPFYLNGARIIAEEALRKQDPKRGVWSNRIGECKHTPAHYGGKTFMTGVLLTGLVHLHRNLPESDPTRGQVETAIIKGCDWVLNEAWMEKYEGFFYAQCPTYYEFACKAAPWMTCEPLAYATEITKDNKYVDIALRSLKTMFAAPPYEIGKHLAMETRGTPHFVAALGKRK